MANRLSTLTGAGNYFEDFQVGDRLRHVRGKTVGEFENQVLTESIPVLGTPFTLNYRSDGVPGFLANNVLNITLSSTSVCSPGAGGRDGSSGLVRENRGAGRACTTPCSVT